MAGLLVSGGESADTPDGQRLIAAMQHLSQACARLRGVDCPVASDHQTLLLTVDEVPGKLHIDSFRRTPA